MSYETARDLPSFKEMEIQLKGMKLLKFLLPADQKNVPKEIEAKLNELAKLIDDFYESFGELHWIFHDMLNVDQVRAIIDGSNDSDEAQQKLISMHADPDFLRRVVMKCNGIPALRKRIPLVEKARDDYLAGRYYSTVFILVSVIDGFVNEFESTHRGAHARTPEELSQYDSAISHHKGIASVQSIFLKPMSITNEEPIYEVYRHGIMHGVTLNFDNEIVATKAWNLLLGFMDWANAKLKAEKPKEPQASLRESLKLLSETRKNTELLKQWKPFKLESNDPDFETDWVYIACHEYLNAWRTRNYGRMSNLLTSMNRKDREKLMPKLVRDEYGAHELIEFALLSIDHYAAAGTDVKVRIKLADGTTKQAELKWLYEDQNGEIGNSMKNDGNWKIVMWGFSFYKEEE
jgi:hypothetical protein